jgi:hypothetical protein
MAPAAHTPVSKCAQLCQYAAAETGSSTAASH